MMTSRRTTFQPHQRDVSMLDTNSHSTFRKSVWTPPDSVQNLVDKVEQIEQRLAHLEFLIGQQVDPEIRRQEQEEVDQSRAELEAMRQELEDAVQKLQQREAELVDTQNKLDNLANQSNADREKLHKLEAQKKELFTLVGELETKLNERVKKITRLEKTVNDLQRSLKNTDNQVTALQEQVNLMQRQMMAFANATAITASSPRVDLAATIATPGSRSSQDQVKVKQLPSTPRPSGGGGAALGLPPIAFSPTARAQNRMNFPPNTK